MLIKNTSEINILCSRLLFFYLLIAIIAPVYHTHKGKDHLDLHDHDISAFPFHHSTKHFHKTYSTDIDGGQTHTSHIHVKDNLFYVNRIDYKSFKLWAFLCVAVTFLLTYMKNAAKPAENLQSIKHKHESSKTFSGLSPPLL